MSDILAVLNPEQHQAATTNQSHVSIVAGPGTGKTKTLVARIAYLLTERHVPASHIAALTFTVKAAREMLDRVTATVGKELARDLRITTFHGLCYDILRQHRNTSFTIIPEPDRLALVKSLRKNAALTDLSSRELLARISWLKSLQPSQLPADDPLASFLQAYNTALQAQDMVDFDDLLLQVYTYLENATMSHIPYILVDEFQDTSDLQYHILHCLQPQSLLVIGDPLQSIYGFRGASGEVFSQFEQDFPQADHITLTTNYRSVPQVVAISNAIFPQAPKLQPHRKNAGITQAVEVLNEYSEAEWVINTIERSIGGTDFLRSHHTTGETARPCSFSDFSILYRTHRVATTLQRQLAESGIPYQVVGDDSPYDQPLICAITSTLRWLAQPTREQLLALHATPPLRALSLRQLEHALAELQADLPLSKLAHRIVTVLNLQPEKPALQRALNQFMGSLVRFDAQGLDTYLQHLDEIAEQAFYDPAANAVTLLTIHASKGLEFDHVFVLACEEGYLPHIRPGAPTDVSEERRLFYVAATRAKTNLDLLHARTRAGQPATVSQFVEQLDARTLPRLIDPALAEQQRRAHKRRHKRSQLGLFG